VLEPALEGAEHLHPSRAVPVRGAEPRGGGAPSLFDHFHQGAVVLEGLEGHRDGGEVGAGGLRRASRAVRGVRTLRSQVRIVRIPAKDNAPPGSLALDPVHPHVEGARKVVKGPAHHGARIESPLGAPGGEVAGELGGVHHGLEDLVDGPGDAGGHAKGERDGVERAGGGGVCGHRTVLGCVDSGMRSARPHQVPAVAFRTICDNFITCPATPSTTVCATPPSAPRVTPSTTPWATP
jgi:hypothetical protein